MRKPTRPTWVVLPTGERQNESPRVESAEQPCPTAVIWRRGANLRQVALASGVRGVFRSRRWLCAAPASDRLQQINGLDVQRSSDLVQRHHRWVS
jgi:hypothetical protein